MTVFLFTPGGGLIPLDDTVSILKKENNALFPRKAVSGGYSPFSSHCMLCFLRIIQRHNTKPCLCFLTYDDLIYKSLISCLYLYSTSGAGPEPGFTVMISLPERTPHLCVTETGMAILKASWIAPVAPFVHVNTRSVGTRPSSGAA